jgi:protein-S-isoprenylcysteine O-methyltransferase Ste14
MFAWGGALLFAVSLSYFLFTYAFTFRETKQASPASAIAVDLALFTVFALHHSVFARERVRAWVARTVPATLERSFYVWVASLLLLGVCALWQPVAGVAWTIAAPAGWLFYLLMATGVWLSVRSAGVIDIWELAGVRQIECQPEGRPRPVSLQASDETADGPFKTDGPYGLVRHPIYLGWFLMVFGVPTMTGTRLAFALVSCGYLLIAIPLEERTLRRTTAGRYDAYMRLVRWRIFPGVY